MWVSADASAPASMSSFDSALAPRAADKCSGVSPYSANITALYLLHTSLCTGELNAIQKQNVFSAVLSTEGRIVGLCLAKLKPKGPKGPVSSFTLAPAARSTCFRVQGSGFRVQGSGFKVQGSGFMV